MFELNPDPINNPRPPDYLSQNPHYVSDGEQIVIDRKRFRMDRHPGSTEDVEIIVISRLPQEPSDS